MIPNLKNFSDFVTEVNLRALETESEALAKWGVDRLSSMVGFECAWYGWAQIDTKGVTIHANASINLPSDYYDFWQTMAGEDLLAAEILQSPGSVATYDRLSGQQNDGMTTLSDRYGIRKMATAMNQRDGRLASFYLSSYRLGARAAQYSREETEFLQCAVDQLGRAMKLNSTEENRELPNGSVSVLVNEAGIGILGLASLREQLGHFWPNWNGDLLPDNLRNLIHEIGRHYLTDRGLVIDCEEAPQFSDMRLRRLTIRKFTPLDLLTEREGEVARLLAQGKSHKDVARVLGVAPSTVRNQTQAIYEKIGVNNRANLASLVTSFD